MNIESIIGDLAERSDKSDDFLSDASSPKEARAAIADVLNKEYPKLPLADKQKVSAALMEILQDEGFFDAGSRRDSWSDGGDADDEE